MDLAIVADAALIVLFVLIGGVFAATEMALVSLRDGQVQRFAAQGARGRRIAALVQDPNLFLSAVQVGVTVAGFLSSAYGASTLAPYLTPVLTGWGLAQPAAEATALVAMTLAIAYLSLVFGELVPKRLAMRRAAAFTRVLAPPLAGFARLMRPVIWLLGVSTDGVLRLLGVRSDGAHEAVGSAEVRAMIASAAGLEEHERAILADVLGADDRMLVEVMRPRPDVRFLPGELGTHEAYERSLGLDHSRLPVTGENRDDVLGFVHVRDLMRARAEADRPLAEIVRPMLALPGTARVLSSLALMREQGDQIALVVDEFGGTDGIVTLEDLLEELVGEIYDEYDSARDPEDRTVTRATAFEVDGGLILQEVRAVTGFEIPQGPYETIGGFVVERLGRLAHVGDVVQEGPWRLEVAAVARRRVRRVVIARDPAASSARDPAAG